MRFGGEVNIDLSDLATNLVPYADLNLVASSYSPYPGVFGQLTQNLKTLFTPATCLAANLPDESRLISVGHILFARGRGLNMGLLRGTLDQICRGNPWIGSLNFKLGVTEGGVDNSTDFCWLRNGQGGARCASRLLGDFRRLRDKKMYLHHYLKFMEEAELDERAEVIRALLAGYEGLGTRLEGPQVEQEEQAIEEKVESLLL